MNGHGWVYSAEEVISDKWPFCFEKYSLWFYKMSQDWPLLSLNTGNREGNKTRRP